MKPVFRFQVKKESLQVAQEDRKIFYTQELDLATLGLQVLTPSCWFDRLLEQWFMPFSNYVLRDYYKE